MKLGLFINYAVSRYVPPVERVQHAEALGFDSVWTAEAYGSDAITPLAFLAHATRRIRLATGVIQIGARTAAMTAMQIATLDSMAGGNRVIAGLGCSGPQIIEGWYGVPWGKPYWKVKDTVAILRKIFARKEPVSHDGRAIQLPYRGDDALGIGKPLRSILHMNPDIPIYLGTGSETMVKLTAEIADGWLPMGFVPGMLDSYRPWLEEGFRRAGGGKSFADFAIQAQTHVHICDDVKAALAAMKPMTAMYVGGMGHESMNFHKDAMARRGWGEAAERIQELFLSGRRQEAIEAVPDDYLDEGALVGPVARIRERWNAWESSGADGLILHAEQDEALELMAELAGTHD